MVVDLATTYNIYGVSKDVQAEKWNTSLAFEEGFENI